MLRYLTISFVLFFSLTSIWGESKISDPELKALFKKMSKAHGVEKASKTLKSLKTVSEIEMTNMGVKMETTTYSAENSARLENKMNGQLIETQVYDGKTVWSNSVMTGKRTLEGSESFLTQLQTIENVLDSTDFFEEIKLGKDQKLGGETVKVLHCKKGDMVGELYVSTKTNLIKGSKITAKTIQGMITVTEINTEYKTYPSGLVFRTVSEIEMGPMKMKLKLTSFEENPSFEPSLFKEP